MGTLYGRNADGSVNWDVEVQPTPARPESLVLAHALTDLLAADAALDKARRSVPNYTGPNSSESYYEEEQEDYNRAADAYADAVQAIARRA